MITETAADLKNKISLLPQHDQLWLMEHLARDLRRRDLNRQQRFEQDLAAMAADPDIQREIKAINEEFAVTESDGLENV